MTVLVAGYEVKLRDQGRNFREADVLRDFHGRFADKPGGRPPQRTTDPTLLHLRSENDLLDMFTAASQGDKPDLEVLEAVDAELARRESDRMDLEAALSSADNVDALSTPFGDLAIDDDTTRQRRIDELVGGGASYLSAYADAHNLSEDELAHQDLAAIVDMQRAPGRTREQTVRQLYHELTELQYLQAEKATNGHLLSNAARQENARRARSAAPPAAVLTAADEQRMKTETDRRAKIDGILGQEQVAENKRRYEAEEAITAAPRGGKTKLREAERVRRRDWKAAYTEQVRAEKTSRRKWDSDERRRAKPAAGGKAPISAFDLFSGPRAVARKWASEELKRFWEEVPRQTYTEFRAMMLGRATDRAAADRIRGGGNGRDFGL